VGVVCSTVAERCGPDFPSVLRQPFALTLYAHQQLMERDRIADLKRREADVHRGVLTAMAFNDPPRLDEARRDVHADMRSPAGRAARRSRIAELRDAGLALAERIERDGILNDARN
jgi:hypothetical protein